MDTDQSIPQFRDNATTRSHDIFFIYSQLPFKYRASARESAELTSVKFLSF